MELDDLSRITIANLSLKQAYSCKSRHLPISIRHILVWLTSCTFFLRNFSFPCLEKWSARSYMDWIRKSRKLQTARTHKGRPQSSSPSIAAVSKRIMSRNKRNENYMKMFWLNWQLLAYFCYKSHTCNFHYLFRFSPPKLKDIFCNCVTIKCHFCMLK